MRPTAAVPGTGSQKSGVSRPGGDTQAPPGLIEGIRFIPPGAEAGDPSGFLVSVTLGAPPGMARGAGITVPPIGGMGWSPAMIDPGIGAP
jgi:hypothetical protein